MISEAKRILWLALPMVATQVLWMTMPIVDNMMVGKLGAIPLAAMAIATTYYWLLQLLCFGILSTVNPLVAHAFGGGKISEMRKILQSALFLALLLSLGMSFALVVGKTALAHLGQDPNLLVISQEYLSRIVLGVPFHLSFIVFRQFCDALENPKPTIILVFGGAILNATLDYLLIYGNGGFPAMGVAGAGMATSLAQMFLCLGLVSYLIFTKKYRTFELFKKVDVQRGPIKEMLRLGLPSSGAMLAEMVYFSGSTLLMGLLGTLEVAAHQIALNVASATFMIPLGVSIAVSVRIGLGAGKRDFRAVDLAGRVGFFICLILGVMNAGFLVLFAEDIVHLYSQDLAVVEMARALIVIAGVFQIFDGLQVLGIYALRGIKDTRIPFLNTLISYALVGMGLSVWLSFYRNQGPMGFWTGMVVALAVAAFLHQRRFKKLISASLFLETSKSKQ